MTRAEAIERGREALRNRAWNEAFTHFSAADREAPLDPAALEQLAMSAHLTGREAETGESLARAHQGFLGLGDPQGAARCAVWLAFGLLNKGNVAQAGGWLARARRMLDDGRRDCVERGYLIQFTGYRAVREGDLDAAWQAFVEAADIGRRFGDPDLTAIATQGQGRILIRRGEIARGVTLLDEAMVAVTAGEVSPIMAGGVYCSVIEACGEIFDLGRAREWTSALEQWCAAQPDMVAFRGHCQVRRAEILLLHGAWDEALAEARRACGRLTQPPAKPSAGDAFYCAAEVLRLRGEFAQAEDAYREAARADRVPRPGLAQLRFAQGQIEAAHAAIRQVAGEVRDPGCRALVLDALAEISLAAAGAESAHPSAQELDEIACRLNAPILYAMSSRAAGAVLLASGDASGALIALRRSLDCWRDLEAPYEAARVRVLIGKACRELGNADAAGLEFSAARSVFDQLGALPDLARLDALSSPVPSSPCDGPLTAREVEVLRLVASGITNRDIAGRLSISEKTVARHLSNIFGKLDLPSRAAATAYAFRQGLVPPQST